MTKELSKIVTTNQDGIHQDLELIVAKQSLKYQRPIADFSIETFKQIKALIKGNEVIFDLGCGIGESSYRLARMYPDKFIIGIDKSISRLMRKNIFKKEKMNNVALFRGELFDLIYLIYQSYIISEIKIDSLYFLYPNPWPKKKHIKRRFHGNSIAPFIFSIKRPIILRSNWRLYLEEFSFVADLYGRKTLEIGPKNIVDPLTPFERKYS